MTTNTGDFIFHLASGASGSCYCTACATEFDGHVTLGELDRNVVRSPPPPGPCPSGTCVAGYTQPQVLRIFRTKEDSRAQAGAVVSAPIVSDKKEKMGEASAPQAASFASHQSHQQICPQIALTIRVA